MIIESLFSLGFEAPINYNLSDFYIQTLAIAAHDREASLERVEVSLNTTIDILSSLSFYYSTFVINMKTLHSTFNMSTKYNNITPLMMINLGVPKDYSIAHQSLFEKRKQRGRNYILENESLDIKQDLLRRFDGYYGDHRLIHFAIRLNFVYVLFSVLFSVF